MGYTDAEMPISERPFIQNYCAASLANIPATQTETEHKQYGKVDI
jgi:hypothetical protein